MAAKGKKPTKGTGGHGRKALRGKGPTPKAEDRPYHKAYKAKKAKQAQTTKPRRQQTSRTKKSSAHEVVWGRNSVVEALRAKIPATALFIAQKVDLDDRVREAIALANNRGIPVGEVTRSEVDRMCGGDVVHQGIALQVPEYKYIASSELLDRALSQTTTPLIVALDGITDPRNLGAIIRSAAAFGVNGIVLPQRRSVGVTASAWKTSAGAAARMPIAMVANLNQVIADYKKRGLFIVGLDGDGDVSLPDFKLSDSPLLLIVGSEGKGLSRLVSENCDQIVSIPIGAKMESLNAGIAVSVALYKISSSR
jgi:23S rRNA (guanosine2251-2'-O)-methyltransferase